MQAAARFLQALIAAVPYRIHTVLTDNGIQFADLPKDRKGFRGHPFDRVCLLHGIDHRLTKPNQNRQPLPSPPLRGTPTTPRKQPKAAAKP